MGAAGGKQRKYAGNLKVMDANRFDTLPESAFVRLRQLLDGRPGAPSPMDLTVGEPRHAIPDFVGAVLQDHIQEFGPYPDPGGPLSLRHAIADWQVRRYGTPPLDAATQIAAVNGTREALFNACLAVTPETKAGQKPIILIPNPFYHCYAAGVAAAGAEPYFWNASDETGNLPDLDAIDDATWDRVAAIFMCSPANPQGAAASLEYWQKLLAKARAHDAVVLADECYSEIYYGTAPVGAIEAAAGDVSNLLIFNSLSKRSNLAGLRCGFVAGEARRIAQIMKLRRLGGAPVPQPLCAVAEACWNDEAHVAASREQYRDKFKLIGNALGNRFGYKMPDGGIFLWLNTQSEWGLDSEAAALHLWDEVGLRVLPGTYLARPTPQGNPGTDYIRIAAVYDAATTSTMLDRLTNLTPKN